MTTKQIQPTQADGLKLLELLFTVYGVPRTAREITVTIRPLEPISIDVNYE